jgi:2-polyprenyl-3-methyl-5-hydroxy-6-metoxy-1,4-benzoquinol methylase
MIEETLSRPEIHEGWEIAYRTPEHERVTDLIFGRIVDEVGAPPEAAWLDVGCGPAYHAIRLAGRGHRVHAMDFSDTALKLARRNVERAGLTERIDVSAGNVLDLPFPDASIDYTLCWGVLMHVPDIATAVQELSRILRPGGRMLISESNLGSWDNILLGFMDCMRGAGVRRRRTPAGLERWFDTPAGPLLTRQTDIAWLSDAFARHGVIQCRRVTGPLTEMYTKLGTGRAAQTIHTLNEAWFRWVRAAGPARANLLILERCQ